MGVAAGGQENRKRQGRESAHRLVFLFSFNGSTELRALRGRFGRERRVMGGVIENMYLTLY